MYTRLTVVLLVNPSITWAMFHDPNDVRHTRTTNITIPAIWIRKPTWQVQARPPKELVTERHMRTVEQLGLSPCLDLVAADSGWSNAQPQEGKAYWLLDGLAAQT